MVLTSGDHTAITLAALESGRHVFVEKPVSYTLRQTDEVIERARQKRKFVMVGMMKQYDPGYRRGVEAVHALRDLRYVDARTLQADDAAYRTHHSIRGGQPQQVEQRPIGFTAAISTKPSEHGILNTESVKSTRGSH